MKIEISEATKKSNLEFAKKTEAMAIAFSEDKAELKKELLATKKCLNDKYKKAFGKGKFEFDKKRLVSDDGKLALQWQVRSHPNSPHSYENQQTSIGKIVLCDLSHYDRESKYYDFRRR